MLELLWVIGIGAATLAFYRFVKERDLQLLGGGDPIGRLEAVARAADVPFFANEARSVATVYFAPPEAANVRMTREGACSVVIPLGAPPPFTGIIYAPGDTEPALISPRRGLVPAVPVSDAWNAQFAILTDNPAHVLECVTDGVVSRFQALTQHGFLPRVVVNQASVRVDARGLWREESEVRRFIDFARFVVEAFALRVEAIRFRDVDADAAPVCRVCGTEAAGGAIVSCAYCETPHHDDCWAYNGGCALFGCAGGPAAPVS